MGSVNQIEPSDLTTTSLGEFSRLPSKLSISVVIGAVVLGAVDAPPAVLAANQPALAVARVAVGEVRRLAVDADRARLLLPLEDAVVGDVAPQQIAPVAEIHRPFRPAAARGEALHAGELQPVFLEARIERHDGRIGIARGLLPAVGEGGDGRAVLDMRRAPGNEPDLIAGLLPVSSRQCPRSMRQYIDLVTGSSGMTIEFHWASAKHEANRRKHRLDFRLSKGVPGHISKSRGGGPRLRPSKAPSQRFGLVDGRMLPSEYYRRRHSPHLGQRIRAP